MPGKLLELTLEILGEASQLDSPDSAQKVSPEFGQRCCSVPLVLLNAVLFFMTKGRAFDPESLSVWW